MDFVGGHQSKYYPHHLLCVQCVCVCVCACVRACARARVYVQLHCLVFIITAYLGKKVIFTPVITTESLTIHVTINAAMSYRPF